MAVAVTQHALLCRANEGRQVITVVRDGSPASTHSVRTMICPQQRLTHIIIFAYWNQMVILKYIHDGEIPFSCLSYAFTTGTPYPNQDSVDVR